VSFRPPNGNNWKWVKLEELAETCSGTTPPRGRKEFFSGGIPWVKTGELVDGVIMATEECVTELALKETRRIGDVLLTEGGDADKLGRGTHWRGELAECILQNHIFRVRFDSNADPAFMSFQFGSEYGKKYFLRHAKQTTGIATVNRTVLGNFPVLVPPLQDQRAISTRINLDVGQAQKLRQQLAERLAALEKIPAAILREVFSGR
jgi:type I restriction enzyme, S subunit